MYGSSESNDVFFVSTGLSYQVSPKVTTGFDFLWREKVSYAGDEKRQLIGFSTQKISKKWSLQEYIIKGIGDSTADWGGGISIGYDFDIDSLLN